MNNETLAKANQLNEHINTYKSSLMRVQNCKSQPSKIEIWFDGHKPLMHLLGGQEIKEVTLTLVEAKLSKKIKELEAQLAAL